MDIITRSVRSRLAATAQAIYGTGALGIASAIMTTAPGLFVRHFSNQHYFLLAIPNTQLTVLGSCQSN